jgi:hypothetical protein
MLRRSLLPIVGLCAALAAVSPCSFAASADTVAEHTEHDAVAEAMIKNALTALNHANLTGNYTVLRDLGSEQFRQRNSAADLAKTFAPHREKHYDFSPILCLAPQLAETPRVQGEQMQLVGFFDTKPEAVHFSVTFRRSESGWALDEITVGMQSLAAVSELPRR